MKIRKCEANDRDQNHESIKINFINPCKEEDILKILGIYGMMLKRILVNFTKYTEKGA